MTKKQMISLSSVGLGILVYLSWGLTSPSLAWVDRWRMPDSWDTPYHSEGAATDGVYLYWSSGNKLAKTLVERPDWENLLAENTHAASDGTQTDQVNGIFLKDGYLYASAPIFYRSPHRFFVKRFNRDTLVFVDERELYWDGVGDTQEGVVYYGGYWWVAYMSRAAVSRYSENWEYLDSIALPKMKSPQVQGIAWQDNRLWVSRTRGRVLVYDWDSAKSVFSLVASFNKPKQMNTMQSMSFSPDGKTIYWADFDADYAYLHIIRSPKIKGLIYLTSHSKSATIIAD